MDWDFKRVSDEPSEKQVNYAKGIAKGLGIDLPADFTREAYSEFISANANKYKRKRQKYSEDENFDWYNEIMNG